MPLTYVLLLFAASFLGMASGRQQERQRVEDLRLTGGDPMVHVLREGSVTIGPGETVIIPAEQQ